MNYLDAVRHIRKYDRLDEGRKDAFIDSFLIGAIAEQYPFPDWVVHAGDEPRTIVMLKWSSVLVDGTGHYSMPSGYRKVISAKALEDADEGWLEIVARKLEE